MIGPGQAVHYQQQEDIIRHPQVEEQLQQSRKENQKMPQKLDCLHKQNMTWNGS